MSKKEKNCLNCRIHWDRDGGCAVCRWEDKDHPSLFYQITRSPEVLAPHLVFFSARDNGWRSMLTSDTYDTYKEAIAATVARLKEVGK